MPELRWARNRDRVTDSTRRKSPKKGHLTREDPLWPEWANCPDCLQHYNLTPALDYAFPSVGIEYAKSAGEMARTYFEAFHKRNGHAS
jgi:hypothetical protein